MPDVSSGEWTTTKQAAGLKGYDVTHLRRFVLLGTAGMAGVAWGMGRPGVGNQGR